MRPTQPSRVSITTTDGEVYVRCSGELDLATAPRLRNAVHAALELAGTCWIDLERVTFLDAAIIHELLRAQRHAGTRRRFLLIAPPSARGVMRPFELLGLLDLLPFTHAATRPRAGGRFARPVLVSSLRAVPLQRGPHPIP